MRYNIPPHMIGALQRYVNEGIHPGGFLSAVISNDLKEACARADDTNKDLIWEYVHFLWNHTPASCWGSPEKMEQWMEHMQLKGTSAEDIR